MKIITVTLANWDDDASAWSAAEHKTSLVLDHVLWFDDAGDGLTAVRIGAQKNVFLLFEPYRQFLGRLKNKQFTEI